MDNLNLSSEQRVELNQHLEKLVNKSKESLDNLHKIALEEAWKLLQLAIASIVQIIENKLNTLSGKDKKAVALECINTFYDGVFVVIDVPFVPNAVEPIIHKYIKSILMIMAGSCIDATVTIFRDVGIFIKNQTGTQI